MKAIHLETDPLPELRDWEMGKLPVGENKIIGTIYGSPDWADGARILTPELIKEQVIVSGGIIYCQGNKRYKLAKRKGT